MINGEFMKKYSLLIVIYILFSTNLFAQIWDLKIELMKTSFICGEHINVLVTLTNKSSITKKYCLLHSEYRLLKFNVRNSKGVALKYYGPIADYDFLPTGDLAPNDSIQELFRIDQDYLRKSIPFPFMDFMEPDIYTIQAKYLNDKVLSNIVTIVVSKPTGNEIQAFDDLKNIFRKQYDFSIDLKVVNSFKEFNRKYPSSIFAPMAMLYLAHSYSILKDRLNAINIIDTLLERYPQSESTYDAVRSLNLSSPQEIDIYDKFLQKHLDHKLKSYISALKKQSEIRLKSK